jgi:hypothetical protein
MSALGSLYIMRGSPGGDLAGCCETADWAAQEIELLTDELAALRAEVAELDSLRDTLGDLLTRTAVALRGPQPPMGLHSWHDLPERAAATIAAIALVQVAERERCAKVCAEYAHTHAKEDDNSKAQAWMMLQCAAVIRAGAAGEGEAK